MIDKTAGLPTQIRNLEKRLKEMDTRKVKPALIKEITDTIKNLKDMLKEKQEKREQRAKAKAEKPQEVEAVAVPMAGNIGATAPNAVTPTTQGQPEATPDDQKVNCPLCGGLTFNDNAALQQHMEFTHASDIAPTTPGQKLDKTVAAVDPNTVKKVETDPKLAPGVIVPDSVKKRDEIVERVEKDPKIAPHIISEQEPPMEKFAVDDKVEPIRGATGSWGHVMRPSGINGDPLVYVKWMDGPIKEKHGEYGGYYTHDLKKKSEETVAAPQPQAEPICKNCESMSQKQGDLKGNYEALLKDLKEERDAHYAQGNHSWTARLDQKIVDLQNAIAEKFGNTEKKAAGGPELIRQINKATSGHGYDSTVYSLTNGRFQQNVPLKINDTTVRMRQPENGTFEVKYPGMDWCLVLEPEFQEWLAEWKQINEKEQSERGAAQNAEELTIMDHTPPRANSGPDAGGKDTHDEFQDEWAMPVTSATKINVLKRELLATPSTEGYDISADGKKLFNIVGKDRKPMNKKQLEFCAQIELTRGMKQAKLTEKVAHLEAGSTVFVMAEDKAARRVKFASIEHGIRGWVPMSKVAFLVKEGQMMKHKDHIDNTFGHNGKETLVDCPNGSGNMVWLGMGELLPINPPPATPESLNDVEAAGNKLSPEDVCNQCEEALAIPGKGKCADCLREFMSIHNEASKTVKCICGDRQDQHANGGACSACKCPKWSLDKQPKTRTVKEMPADRVTRAAKECADCHGHFEGKEGETCPTCGRFAVQKAALKQALPPVIMNQRTDVQAAINKVARVVHREDGWHVLSEKGKNLGGPYKSKGEAVKRLRQVEYFKHHGAIRPFSKTVIAEIMSDPYQTLTTHITDMRSRMSEVQERIQNVPAVKTAGEDNSKLDLPGLFADLTQGIDLLETKLGGDENSDPTVHKMIEELENKLWKLEEECGLTPELSEHEKAEPEHKEIVEDIEKEAAGETMATKCTCGHMWKDHTDNNDCSFDNCDCKSFSRLHKQADQVTDETTETTVTNDPNATVPPAATTTPAPLIQNVQPTDDDNLEIPTQAPTSPLPSGQKWQWDSTVGKYVVMTDPASINKAI